MSNVLTGGVFRFGRFELRAASRELLVDGQPVKLGARALDVLLVLVERRERGVSKSELLELVWPGLVVEENNLQVHVSALRKIVGPPVIATIPGHGYRFTALLNIESESPMSHAASHAPHNNLPRPRTRFVGRGSGLNSCTRLLRDGRLLTLTGIGGCGKTRLAIELAQQCLAQFPDGVWFVDLASLQEPQRVAPALASLIGMREAAGSPLIERLVGAFASRRALVLLDNCEQVIDAVAELVDALLSGSTDLKILSTSREGLGVAGEQVYPVGPLSTRSTVGVPSLPDAEAVQLFVDRACLMRPDFAIDANNADAVVNICQRLDGIALAIELAAARVPILSVEEIGSRLDDRFRFLTGGNRALPRHQTLRATLQWSYDSLSPQEQRLFLDLGIFVNGCTLDAVAEVADCSDPHAVLERLTRIHDKSLLVVDIDRSTAPRYRMLETVRQYALERLGESPLGETIRSRHLRWMVALAEEARPQIQGPRQGAWLARLRLEQENLLAAHAWCEQSPVGDEAGIRLAASLWRYWVASGQLERGYRLTRSALAASGERADPLWNCRALWALGQIAFRIGRYDETLQCGDRCLAIGRSIDSAESIAEGLILRGGGLHAIGELAQARSAYENARELAQTAGARFELVAATHGLAEVHRALGKLDVAESCYREAVDAARDLQDPRAAAVPLCNLARLLIASGKFERARSVLLDSLVLADAAGLKGMGEQVLDVAAGLAAKVGDAANAALFLGTASACLREAGSRRQPDDEAFIVPLLATARARLGPVAFDAAELEGTRLTYDAATRLLQRWLQNLVIADADWDPQRGEFADPASDIGKRDGFLESPVASGPGPSAVRA